MKRRLGAALVLASALLSGVAGCSVLPGLGGTGAGNTNKKQGGKVLDLPQKTVYSKGDAVNPSAGLTTGAPVRGPLASISPLPRVSRSYPTPSMSPTDCTGVVRPGVINGVEVVPGTASATVSWWNIGDPSIVSYQLTAMSQELLIGPQPGWTWQTVPPGKGCTRVTTTVTGLISQTPYVFVVHAVLKKYESLPPTAPEVARSEAVTML
ncbi:fibronectin type III domain-containing protein [Dactylosporangium sp. NPDC006015]|uniref:fibronectin type III domain-containing protein n=1 Tax=Dactylosporangium sp. NPDC006015 TaxID=3154576 RepID=UPI0033BBA311